MSVHGGPKSVIDSNLILSLDATNYKSVKSDTSVIKWNTWTVGAGGATNYTQNGDGNSRLYDTNPFGVSDIVWDVSNQDAASDADGGWETSSFAIDITKTYRFTTWVRRKTIGNGSFYLGPHSNWSSTAGQFILNRSDSAENNNPYFYAGNWWGNANQWYLVVGHVWAAGSGSGQVHVDSGIYDTSGNKVASTIDFMWAGTNTTSFHRSYLYYSTDTTTNQQWYQPRVDICNGSEPSISELLNNIGNKWLNLSSTVNGQTVGTTTPIITDVARCFDFSANNGLNSTSAVSGFYFNPQPILNTGSFTINAWVKNVPATVGQQLLFSNTADGNGYRFGIGANGVYYLIGPDYTEGTLPFSSFTNTQWNNVCVIFDRAGTITPGTPKMYLYLNGSLVTNSTLPASQTAWTTSGYTTAYMGKWNSTTFSSFSGKLGKFEIFNRALSSSEIRQNFNALRNRYAI